MLYWNERYDGLGYPRGIVGEAIPLGARILNLCDSYDALIGDRPYKEAILLDEAIAEIRRCTGYHTYCCGEKKSPWFHGAKPCCIT